MRPADLPDGTETRTVRITKAATGRQEAAVAGGTRSIRFSAAGSRVTRVRVGLQGAL
ncbi:hypothetical protein K7B10_20065 [Streptomyces flavotricini]|uniref:Uncharacterized protein n=1 Tax=Streptomyces flavotricini TaxID=66888 RepID=A0ABS8E7A9_9ACTN|nr:hypothetical protein [Streptomyces flavotricini]MCC0097046.1 hypothetical protein [Streptomyces flavotricini]